MIYLDKCIDGIIYRWTSDGWIVDECDDKDILEADIPAYIDNHPVVQIEHEVFHGCESLEAVWIPETIEDIENYAFADCINLRAFHSESKNLALGTGAFLNCRKLKKFYTAGTVFIGVRAFANCLLLNEFVGSIDGLQDKAFVKCASLKQPLVFSEELIHFYATAFENSGIDELHFDGNIPEIKKSKNVDLSKFIWAGVPNSNILEFAYDGYNVIVMES